MQSPIVPERFFNGTLEEEVFALTFPSGLRTFLCRKPGFKKQYACYSAFYGSVDSEFVLQSGAKVQVPDGIAHFLEHTLFETPEGNASDLFSQRGAYNNAATSFTTTTYLFAAAELFYENLELLLRFVENPVFDPAKVEKEKGIIEQEIQGYKDHPYWVSYMGLLENLFQRHPMRIDIAGTVESIRQIDSATLHRCYDAFYHPSNMILFVVGDVDPEALFPFVEEKSRHAKGGSQNGGNHPEGPAVERVYPREAKSVFRRETRQHMQVALPKMLLGFKDVDLPLKGDEFVLHDLASGLALEILFGRSSETYQELYEAGLILEDFGAGYSTGAGIGHGMVGGETPSPDKLRDILLSRIDGLLSTGISPEDFARSKRSFMGAFIRGFNSLEYIATNFTHLRFYDFDLFRSIDLLAQLDRETLEARIRSLLDPTNFASFVVLPS